MLLARPRQVVLQVANGGRCRLHRHHARKALRQREREETNPGEEVPHQLAAAFVRDELDQPLREKAVGLEEGAARNAVAVRADGAGQRINAPRRRSRAAECHLLHCR